MSTIDTNSLTWQTVLKFCEKQREAAVDNLIADRHPERARGSIQTLEALEALANQDPAPVVPDQYV